jgi:hypothetical protein
MTDQFGTDIETTSGGVLNMDIMAKISSSQKPMTQEQLVEQFCNDDSIFAHINRRRKIAEEEPEKQKIISASLWYFADKTLEETRKIWDYVTQGRWRDDYEPPTSTHREEMTFDDEDEKAAEAAPQNIISDGIFNVPESLHQLLKKRLEELEKN